MSNNYQDCHDPKLRNSVFKMHNNNISSQVPLVRSSPGRRCCTCSCCLAVLCQLDFNSNCGRLKNHRGISLSLRLRHADVGARWRSLPTRALSRVLRSHSFAGRTIIENQRLLRRCRTSHWNHQAAHCTASLHWRTKKGAREQHLNLRLHHCSISSDSRLRLKRLHH